MYVTLRCTCIVPQGSIITIERIQTAHRQYIYSTYTVHRQYTDNSYRQLPQTWLVGPWFVLGYVLLPPRVFLCQHVDIGVNTPHSYSPPLCSATTVAALLVEAARQEPSS